MSYAREMDSPAFIYIFLGLYGIFHIKIWLLKMCQQELEQWQPIH